jgi:hypothetical protein
MKAGQSLALLYAVTKSYSLVLDEAERRARDGKESAPR